jgi:hypothetical protein
MLLLLLLPCNKLQKENRKNRQRDSFLVYVCSVPVEKKIAPDAIITGLQQDRKRNRHTHRACLCMHEVPVENKTAADCYYYWLTTRSKKEKKKEKKEKTQRNRPCLCRYVRFSVEKKYCCGCLITRLQ